MFLARRRHVRSVEQTILRAGEKTPIHTMPWVYRTRTSTTKSSLSRSLDHLEDRRSKQFRGSLQSSLLLPLSDSNRKFEFQKGSQLFIRAHKETFSVVAMSVCNPDRSPV